MKRKIVYSILFISLCLTACGRLDKFEAGTEKEPTSVSEHPTEIPEVELNDIDGLTKYKEVSYSGPAGTISVQIPKGWESLSFPACGDYESYSIRFYPGNVEKGYIELAYINPFGVCGTGLANEEITIAGDTASMGTYDNHEHWDYIAYEGKNKGLVATTFFVDDWWDEYTTQVMEVLGTASFNAEDLSNTEGIVYNDTKVGEIGLSMSIRNIRRTSAELSFIQYDGNPKGNLEFGDDFIIERIEKGEWVEASTIVEGDYGFNDNAYPIIKEDVTDFEIDWEWLYGELEPGEYRIGKNVIDFVDTGSYDKYKIYIQFVIN